MRELGGKSDIPQIMSLIPLEKERGIHQGFQRREAVEGSMSSTSRWKGKDGEDSALALQGARALDAGRGGQRNFQHQHPKGPGKRQGGSSEKQLPKEKSCSKAGMLLCQQNDVNSTFSWKDLL